MVTIAILSGAEYNDTDMIETHDIVITDGVVTKNRNGSIGQTVDVDRLLMGIATGFDFIRGKVVNVTHNYPPKSYRIETHYNDSAKPTYVVHVPVSNSTKSHADTLIMKAVESMKSAGFENVIGFPFRD